MAPVNRDRSPCASSRFAGRARARSGREAETAWTSGRGGPSAGGPAVDAELAELVDQGSKRDSEAFSGAGLVVIGRVERGLDEGSLPSGDPVAQVTRRRLASATAQALR